ncbi:unnamed protein product, partial [Mycena citricolor]
MGRSYPIAYDSDRVRGVYLSLLSPFQNCASRWISTTSHLLTDFLQRPCGPPGTDAVFLVLMTSVHLQEAPMDCHA